MNVSVATGAASAARVDVDSAEVREVQGEKLKLPRVEGAMSYNKGAALRQVFHIAPGAGIPVQYAVDASSVVVRHGEQALVAGKDYLFDGRWNTLALGPEARVGPDDEVSVDYRYSLLRVDSLVREADGRQAVRKGQSHLAIPRPPELEPGQARVANILVPYSSDGRGLPLWPILETPEQARTRTTPGRLPRAMAKLRAGEPLKIVCWGDSVTEGGDVSQEAAYPAVFARRMQAKFPSKIEVKVVAVGGSNSRQWLQPQKFPFHNPKRQPALDWERVAREKPDVVTLEFVNDSYLQGPLFDEVYSDILQRVRALGAEMVLITPHFVQTERAGFEASRKPEQRPYVLALRDFATRNNLALADASGRWEHLWREGIPYSTLLANAFNHPDDRGHALFADELMKVFAEEK